MSVSVEGDRRRRTRKRLDYSTSRIAVFSLAVLLILSEARSLSSAEKLGAGSSRWSPARKARFFGRAATSYYARGSSTPPLMASGDRSYESSSSDKLYREAKRLVHTGPNPLHN